MRNTKLTRVVANVAAALITAAALAFPFTVSAQNAAPSSPSLVNLNLPLLNVILHDGTSAPRPLVTHGPTVADALAEAGILLDHPDRTQPSPATPVTQGMTIIITRVRMNLVSRTEPIPFKTVFKMSASVPAGRIQKGATGQNGALTRTYLLSFVNNHQTARKLVKTTVTRPAQDNETLAGIRVREARALPSRAGTYQRMRSIDMTATGYSPYEGSGAGLCATGMRAGYGVVAVDPRVVRLGTRLYIEGYGYAVAGDTGGAIKGRRIDLGHTTYREAANVGRRHVKVWILSPTR